MERPLYGIIWVWKGDICMEYTWLYSTTLLVSLILTGILYQYHSRYWNADSYRPLQVIYLLNMTSALMCIAWALVEGKPQLVGLNYLCNMIEFNCMGYCGYFWLRYCLKYLDIPRLKTRLAKGLMALPILMVTLGIVTTHITHWAFYIDRAGCFHRGSIYIMQQTGYLYLLFSSGLCLSYRKHCQNYSQRRRLTVLSLFPIPPALFGGLQILAPSGVAPTLQFSVLVSLLLVFVDELDQKITRDSLTRLTNRFEFERILQNRMAAGPKGSGKLFVLMADLDDFKSINDTYGHQQGDVALKIVAQVMAKTADENGAICARMSGDEFVALQEADSIELAQMYRLQLIDRLELASINLPYPLQLSVGIAQYNGSESMMALLHRADENMYAEKRRKKAQAKVAQAIR